MDLTLDLELPKSFEVLPSYDFMEDHARDLELICASAAYKAEQTSCDANTYKDILTEASSLINEHVKTYHGSVQTVMKGVSSCVLGLAASGNPFGIAAFGAAVGIEAGAGIFEATTSTSYVLRNLDTSSAAGSSLTAPAMFNLELKKEYPIDSADITKLLSTAGFPESANPTLPCTSLATINLGSFDVRPSCDKINALYSPSASESAKAQLSVGLKDALFKRMRGIISQSFVQPAAGFIASAAADPISDKVEAHVKKMRAKERAQQQAAIDKVGKGPAAPWQDPDKLEKTNLKELTKDEAKKLNEFQKSQLDRIKVAREALVKETSEQKSQAIRQKLANDLQSNYQKFSQNNPMLSSLAKAEFIRAVSSMESKPLSYKEWKKKELRFSALKDMAIPYAQERGGYSDIEVAAAMLPMSESDYRNGYSEYLSNHFYIQDSKQIVVDTLYTTLQHSEQLDHGFQFLKVGHRIYIVGKATAKGGILLGGTELSEISPSTFASIRNKLAKFGKVVGIGIKKADGKLQGMFGERYSKFKLGSDKFFTEFNRNAPEIVQDITGLLATKGITGGTLAVAGSTVRGTGAVARGARAAAKRTSAVLKDAANKAVPVMSRVSRAASTATNKVLTSISNPKYLGPILQPSRVALATNGAKVWGYFDDKVAGACRDSKALFSVAPKATASSATTQPKILTKIGSNAGNGFKHHVEIDVDLLKRKIDLPSDLNSPKLRRKFEDHKGHFGMESANFNTQNANLFKHRIVDHINDPNTVAIAGEYTRGSVGKVVHFYNPNTGLNVMKDINGNYVSGWKLNPDQIKYLKLNGKIGGV